MTFTILPCPFCGQPGEMRETYQRITVGCFNDNCLAAPFVAINYIRTRSPEPYKPGLISAWNTRTPAVEDGELVEALVMSLKETLDQAMHYGPTARAELGGHYACDVIERARAALARHKASKSKQ